MLLAVPDLKFPKKADKDRCVEKDLKHRPENMASKATDFKTTLSIFVLYLINTSFILACTKKSVGMLSLLGVRLFFE